MQLNRRELLLALVLAFCGAVIVVSVVRAADQAKFDHSTCQYPGRDTNPPNGCDNSDPADPTCVIKSGKDDCQSVSTAVVAPAASDEVVAAPPLIPTGKCYESN